MIPSRRGALAVLLTLGALAASVRAAGAQDTTWREGVRLRLDVRARNTRPGVLILPVSGVDGDSIRRILTRDLVHGDRTTVLDLAPEAVPPPNANGTWNYPLFQNLGADVVVQVVPTSFGVQVTLHSVGERAVARANAFPLPSPSRTPDWRLAVHTIADDIEQIVTGVRGISATRILYVSQGRVWQIDSDGANPTAITGDVRALSPTWHPAGGHMAYTSLTDAGARVIIREVGGPTRTLATGAGLAQSPAFSRPDGNTLVYSAGNENGMDLVAASPFGSEPPRRVSIGRGSDNMSPTFSHDGRRIAYTTNRLGRIDIFVADADGTNAEPLVPQLEPAYRSDPDWSPDGRLIAFQMQFGGNFQLMLFNVLDRSVKQQTSSGVNENASFAPDSRHIVFTSTRSGIAQLWIMDTQSGTARQLTHGNSRARHAAWSPLLRTTRR
ncbi:MAG: PD40 domain-containing protein [Gemmatimonadetes bacterium]|nr:PD40 domain-containing protein [Gemmatimonadota bacterium]